MVCPICPASTQPPPEHQPPHEPHQVVVGIKVVECETQLEAGHNQSTDQMMNGDDIKSKMMMMTNADKAVQDCTVSDDDSVPGSGIDDVNDSDTHTVREKFMNNDTVLHSDPVPSSGNTLTDNNTIVKEAPSSGIILNDSDTAKEKVMNSNSTSERISAPSSDKSSGQTVINILMRSKGRPNNEVSPGVNIHHKYKPLRGGRRKINPMVEFKSRDIRDFFKNRSDRRETGQGGGGGGGEINTQLPREGLSQMKVKTNSDQKVSGKLEPRL